MLISLGPQSTVVNPTVSICLMSVKLGLGPIPGGIKCDRVCMIIVHPDGPHERLSFRFGSHVAWLDVFVCTHVLPIDNTYSKL